MSYHVYDSDSLLSGLRETAVPEQKSILKEAYDIIHGDREKTYGNPVNNLEMIADLWTSYAGRKFSANDVCCMMVLLKLARLKNQPDHRDSQVDIAGYIGLLDRIQNTDHRGISKEEHKPTPL